MELLRSGARAPRRLCASPGTPRPGKGKRRGRPAPQVATIPEARALQSRRPDSSGDSRGGDGDPRGGKAAQGPLGSRRTRRPPEPDPAAEGPRRQQRDSGPESRGKSDGARRARHSLAGMRTPQEHEGPGRGDPLDDGLWPTPGSGPAHRKRCRAHSGTRGDGPHGDEASPGSAQESRARDTLRSPRLSGTKELGNHSPDYNSQEAPRLHTPSLPHPEARAVPAGICSPRRRKADPEAGSAPTASPTSFHVLSPVAAATRGRAGRGVVVAAGARVHVFLHRARFVPLAPRGGGKERASGLPRTPEGAGRAALTSGPWRAGRAGCSRETSREPREHLPPPAHCADGTRAAGGGQGLGRSRGRASGLRTETPEAWLVTGPAADLGTPRPDHGPLLQMGKPAQTV